MEQLNYKTWVLFDWESLSKVNLERALREESWMSDQTKKNFKYCFTCGCFREHFHCYYDVFFSRKEGLPEDSEHDHRFHTHLLVNKQNYKFDLDYDYDMKQGSFLFYIPEGYEDMVLSNDQTISKMGLRMINNIVNEEVIDELIFECFINDHRYKKGRKKDPARTLDNSISAGFKRFGTVFGVWAQEV